MTSYFLQLNTYLRSFIKPPRMSWTSYWIKSVAVTIPIILAMWLFSLRFTIGIDPQQATSIVGTRYFLIDHSDTNLIRGKLYAFRSPNLNPFYSENTRFIKYLVAVPGDHIKVDTNNQIWINGLSTPFMGLPYAQSKLGQDESKFQGEITLKDNQYWFLGDYNRSFDSRYWGSIGNDRIIGRAFKLD